MKKHFIILSLITLNFILFNSCSHSGNSSSSENNDVKPDDVTVTSDFIRNYVNSDGSVNKTALQAKLDEFDSENTTDAYFILSNSGNSTEQNWKIAYGSSSGKSGNLKTGMTNAFDAANCAMMNLPSDRTSKLKVLINSDIYANEPDSCDPSNAYNSKSRNISNFYAINVPSNCILDFNGHTLHANSTDATQVVPLSILRQSNVSVRNLIIEGAARYAIWCQGSENVVFDTIELKLNENSGLGLRIANRNDTWSKNIYVDNIKASGVQDQAVETMKVENILVGTVTATDCNDCGLLLNTTKYAVVGTVNGTRCSPRSSNGVYAAMRCANYCGPEIFIGTVNAVECGRSFFSVSANKGITVTEINSTNSWAQPFFIQDTQDLTILKATLTSGSHNNEKAIEIATGSAGGTLENDNLKFYNIKIKGYKYGAYQRDKTVSTNVKFTNVTFENCQTEYYGF